jgi:hypothetical protein
VEYLGSISRKNLKGIIGEIFVGYFEEDFLERILTTIIYLLISTRKQTF